MGPDSTRKWARIGRGIPFGLTLTFAYDAAGNRTLVQDSKSGVTTSVYEPVGQLTSRQYGGSGQTPLREDLTWTPAGQVSTEKRYKDLAGTQLVGTTSYVYDGDGNVTNLQHRNASGTLLANYTYTFDKADELTSEKLNGTTTSYGYDNSSELTSAGTATYSYDGTGNRTLTGYVTGTGNQLLKDGTWTYTYDAEGNLIKKSKGSSAETVTYAYDQANRLIGETDRSTDGGGTLLSVAEQRVTVRNGVFRSGKSWKSLLEAIRWIANVLLFSSHKALAS